MLQQIFNIPNYVQSFLYPPASTANPLETWREALALRPTLTHAVRGTKAYYMNLRFMLSEPDGPDRWKGATLAEFKAMLAARKFSALNLEMDLLEVHIAHGRAFDLHLTHAEDKLDYAVKRIDRPLLKLAKQAGLQRKYPALYETDTTPQLRDLIIDGTIYEPGTSAYDFLIID